MRWRGVCRLSVCPSVCKLFCGNRYYDAKNGSIATKLAQDGQHVGAHPCCAQGRGQGQRSRDTGAFVPITKIASCRRRVAGLRPNLHTMVPRCGCIQGCAQGQGQGQGSRARGSFVLARETLLLRGKWSDCDQTCTQWSPGQHAYRMCPVSRSRSSKVIDTGIFVLDLKSLFLAGR